MSKQQLKQRLIVPQKQKTLNQQSWLTRYNDVIQVYNQYMSKSPHNNNHTNINNNDNNIPPTTTTTTINHQLIYPNTNYQKLHSLQFSSKFHLFLNKLIDDYLLNILMVICLIFLPIFNIILQIFLIKYLLFLKQQVKKHDKNIEISPQPFKQFYFYPEMCEQVGKHFTVLNLTVQEIENFTFNSNHQVLKLKLMKNVKESKENINSTNNKNTQNQQVQYHNINKQHKQKHKIKIPIYDQYFYDSFFLVKKQLYKAFSWVVLGSILIVISAIFYIAFFQIQFS